MTANFFVHFTARTDFSHTYFFRGIRQESGGLITQPYADMSFEVYSDNDGQGLSRVKLTLGQWNGLPSGPTGAGGSAENVGVV